MYLNETDHWWRRNQLAWLRWLAWEIQVKEECKMAAFDCSAAGGSDYEISDARQAALDAAQSADDVPALPPCPFPGGMDPNEPFASHLGELVNVLIEFLKDDDYSEIVKYLFSDAENNTQGD